MIITDFDLTTPSNKPRPFVLSSVPPPAKAESLPVIGAHLRSSWRGDAIIPKYPDDTVLSSVQPSTTPDLTKCSRGSSWEGILRAGTGLPSSWVDPRLSLATDQFYLLCQWQRDSYKDRSGTRYPLDMFAHHEPYGHCPPTLFDLYLRSPINYVTHKQPYVIPLTSGRSLQVPDKPKREWVRRHDKGVDLRWKP